MCIEQDNPKVYEYILNKYKDQNNVKSLIDNLYEIIPYNENGIEDDASDNEKEKAENKKNKVAVDFYNYIEDYNKEYNTDILDHIVKILEEVIKLGDVKFDNIFNISKTTIVQRSDTKNEKDRSKYELDGKGPFSKRRLVWEVMQKAVLEIEPKTYDVLNNKMNGYLKESNILKEKFHQGKFFDHPIILDNKKYYLSNQWGTGKMSGQSDFSEFLEIAINDLGYNIEKCEE